MTWLVCLLAFSSLCIIGEALTRRDMFHVMLFCAVLMNMLSATAGTMVEFGPVITNFGSVIYSVITFCIGVLAFRTPGRIPLSLVILAMATWLIVLA